MEPTSNSHSSLTLPIAIVIGFALVAVAIFFTAGRADAPTEVTNEDDAELVASGTPAPVTDRDYIRGNPNAPILLIEYSDYDCPFCKQYHATMNRIMDEYGVTGRVAWVYRQFPLAQLHPNSPRISQAALCVGKVGGNDAFWTFTDLIFDKRDATEPTNVTAIPEYAETAGVSAEEYTACMDSGETIAEVEASVEDALNVGARGTPYTVVVVGSQQAVINGAQPYSTVKSMIDSLISQLDGGNGQADTMQTESATQ